MPWASIVVGRSCRRRGLSQPPVQSDRRSGANAEAAEAEDEAILATGFDVLGGPGDAIETEYQAVLVSDEDEDILWTLTAT